MIRHIPEDVLWNMLICLPAKQIAQMSSETVVHIWNPSLSALATLPHIDSTLDANDHMQFRFGYDPINDDYKVVKVMFRFGGSHLDEIQDAAAVELFSMIMQDSYPKVVEYVESLVWPPSLRANMEN
nr:hypothetical protein [Tanacetum cinerariifolium]